MARAGRKAYAPETRKAGSGSAGNETEGFARAGRAIGATATMALGFTLFVTKGVIIMTDYEILAIIIMVITLAFAIHNGTHK